MTIFFLSYNFGGTSSFPIFKKRNNKKCCKKSNFVEVENLEKLPIFAMKFHKIFFFMFKRNFEKLK